MRDDRDVTVIETGSGGGFRWFLLGAAIGAALGVLFAPERGDITRSDLARRGRRIRRRAETAFDEFADDLGDRGRRVRDAVEEIAGEMREGKRRVVREAASSRDELERRLADARSRARAAVNGEPDTEDDDTAE